MLRVDTALYGAAIAVDRLLALALLPLLTRAIGAADYGLWTQTLVGSAMLMPLVVFGLPTAIVRSYAGAGHDRARLHALRRLGALVLALFALVAVLLWLARAPAARLIWGDDAQQRLLPALLLLLAAEALVDFATAWLRAAGRMGWIAAVLIARSVLRYALLWALVVGAGMAIADWLGWFALAQLLLAAAVLALAVQVLRRGAAPTEPRNPPPGEGPGEAAGEAAGESTAAVLRFALPLVALSLFTLAQTSADRFILVRLLGLDAVAVYAAAVSLCTLPAVFHGVLGFTLFPVLARAWHAGQHAELRRLTRKAVAVFLALALPSAAAIAAAGPWLLPWLATPSFQPPWPVFAAQGVAVLAFGVYQILLYPLLLQGRSGQVLRLAMGAALLNLLANLVLVPRLGLSGAALAAAVANLLVLLWTARLAARGWWLAPTPQEARR